MKIRTYFWHDRVVSRPEMMLRRKLRLSPQRHFLVGNAGDLLAADVIRRQYGCDPLNVARQGRRLLVVGSIVDRIMTGDVVCGAGVKTRDIPRAKDVSIRVWGVRGPISQEVLQRAGHDVSNVRFRLDPGLLVRFMTTEAERSVVPRGVAFVPHYRERNLYRRRLPAGMRMIDIDAEPLDVCREILGAELIYSSSLHGLIFAHALERPCVLVAPQTVEPSLKYEDYFASIEKPMPKTLSSIDAADYKVAPCSPEDVQYQATDFQWPDRQELMEWGITEA